MAYVYSGDNYRGGATGVENDYALRQYYAQQAAEALRANQNLPTSQQISTAKGDLAGAQTGYEYLMHNGMYTPGEMQGLESAAVQNINNTTRALQQNVNANIASRGAAGNAGINAALSMTDQFKAAGQRGQTRADLTQKNKESQLKGLEGYTDLSQNMATLSATPVQQDVNAGQYMDLYDDWRNSAVGYDGAKWATEEPEEPDYYGEEVGGDTKKKKNAYEYGGFGYRVGF